MLSIRGVYTNKIIAVAVDKICPEKKPFEEFSPSLRTCFRRPEELRSGQI